MGNGTKFPHKEGVTLADAVMTSNIRFKEEIHRDMEDLVHARKQLRKELRKTSLASLVNDACSLYLRVEKILSENGEDSTDIAHVLHVVQNALKAHAMIKKMK
jgi:hypothetical protein